MRVKARIIWNMSFNSHFRGENTVSKLALVTGATGQLGSNLAIALLEQGWNVRALARSKDKAQKILGDTNAEIIIGDMENVDGFASALQGVDVVFHTAAYFREYFGKDADHWTQLKKINIDATMRLIELADQAGVKKFIHTSSSGTIGKAENGHAGDENTPPDDLAMSNLYFKSKILTDQKIMEWLKTNTRMPVMMILPTVMIGTRDAAPTGMGQAIISIAQGQFPVVLPGGFEFVDSRDVAQAMINTAEKGRSSERYIISQGYHSIQDLIHAVAKVNNAPIPRIQLNYPMAILMARLAEFGARISGTEPRVTTDSIRAMSNKHTVNTQKAQHELGTTYRPFTESIRDEVNWYKENGYIKEAVQA
jgi:dihydroflavonol-4-reductase